MDLSDRLKSLGVNLGLKHNPPSPNTAVSSNVRWPIEAVVPGYEHKTQNGSVFISINDYALDYSHGRIHLNNRPDMTMLAAWGKTPRLPALPHQQIVFLDTETSGLAGGTGTYSFLVGLGCFTENSFQVTQFFMRAPDLEEAFLIALVEWLHPFQALVTFNGKSFDIPLLRTRYILNGIDSPFHEYEHIDLLHLARRLWRNRLESRALGDLEREIIGFSRDQEDIPGYLIPQYYFDYLSSGDARPLKGVFYHNRIDIISLAALFNYIGSILSDPFSSHLHTLDIVAIARLYEETGLLEEAATLYESGLKEGLPEQFFLGTIERFALLRRKQGRYDLSASLWEKAASYGHLLAFAEISKYQEHHLRKYEEALIWSLKGLELSRTLKLTRYQTQMWEEKFKNRILRLEKKISLLDRKDVHG